MEESISGTKGSEKITITHERYHPLKKEKAQTMNLKTVMQHKREAADVLRELIEGRFITNQDAGVLLKAIEDLECVTEILDSIGQDAVDRHKKESQKHKLTP